MKKILTLILMLTLCKSFAQSGFRKGEIIKVNGQKLLGELVYDGDVANSKSIRFINQDIDTIYKPFEIESYSFDNGKHYISKIAILSNDTTKIFAELLASSKKEIFFTRSYSSNHYLISLSDSVIKEIPFKIETVNINGINYQKESKLYIGYLKSYFKDCPALFPDIENLKSLNRKTLISLVKKYHEITNDEGNFKTYNRKENLTKIAIEPVFSLYTRSLKFDKTLNATGGNLYLGLPNLSDKLSLKTGFHIASYNSYKYIQLPLQVEFVYSSKIINPKYNIGINIHFTKENENLLSGGLTALAGGGCYIRLTNWAYLDFDISSDLFAFNYETRFIETVNLRTGLLIKIKN